MHSYRGCYLSNYVLKGLYINLSVFIMYIQHFSIIDLSYDGGQIDLSFDGGMHCVEKKSIGSFKDKAIFHVILEIDR